MLFNSVLITLFENYLSLGNAIYIFLPELHCAGVIRNEEDTWYDSL